MLLTLRYNLLLCVSMFYLANITTKYCTQKEIGDLTSDSITQIRTLLPIPKEHNYVSYHAAVVIIPG